ncbi:potassium transporter TrkG [Psychrobacter sp. JCM 18901]|uniref:potassium transporter TrkG n=1 Tax=Psychrobacter sp. JCM 18901 TaxID=1298609 RepID=UPI0021C45A26|nr:potassium transporter TrkG [Psychrobacter sp. JCM 18901]
MSYMRGMGDVVSTLKSILYVTFAVEAVAAALIYISIYDIPNMDWSEQLFFSVFHAISAFCNAGFSTFSAGLYDDSLRFNYSLQLILAMTFIFGGMGFTIVVNVLRYLRYRAQRLINRHDQRYIYQLGYLISIAALL